VSFSLPVDPRYTRFADGMKAYLNGSDSPTRTRWHPLDGKWFSYPLASHILEDAGIAPTETPAEPSLEQGSGGQWVWVFTFDDYDLRDTFKAIDAAFEAIKGRFPDAVWNGRSGEWRQAIPRPPDRPPPTGGTHDLTGLPEEAKARIERVREAERANYITPDQAAELIKDIVDEYS
jgi:hypothetical protein